jgi:hypothetical protein
MARAPQHPVTIVGNGVDPAGNTEAWIVTIPEPGPAAAIALGRGIRAARGRRRAASPDISPKGQHRAPEPC